MIPLEQFRRFVFGSEATAPAPKPIWGEPSKETSSKAAAPQPSGLLKLRGIVGIFLVANICIGGYLIAKSTGKPSKKREKRKEAGTPLVAEPVFIPPPQPQPIPQRKITLKDQRQLFTWMLDEKRKLKPSSKAEKARIDEDKKVLKQFLRATNFPQL